MTRYSRSNGIRARLIRYTGDRIAIHARGDDRLCIVNYHRILESRDPLIDSEPDVNTFRWQMQSLADCFNVLPLDEALRRLAEGTLPPRAVCITFDDGYRSTHDLALPILRQFNLPATVFVTTGYIGEGNMWNDRILEAIRRMPSDELDLSEINAGVHSLKTLTERKLAVKHLTEVAKYLPPRERTALTCKVETLAGGAALPSLMLTDAMIRELAAYRIEIGGHTISHPILTSLSDAEAHYEIATCKRELEAITNKPVRYFAYPNGKYGIDFDARHQAMAHDAGFEAAFTTAVGPARASDDLYTLPRSRPWDETPFLYVLRLLRWLS